MLKLLNMMVVGVTMVTSLPHFCPPACDPPANNVGCMAFRRASDCKQGVIDIGIGPTACGCKWQEYIVATDVHKRGKIIFTDDGEDCFTWAAVTCGLASTISQEENSKALEKEISVDIVEGLKGIVKDGELRNVNLAVPDEVKTRRRNGVKGCKQIKYSHQDAVTTVKKTPSTPATTMAKIGSEQYVKGDIEFIGKHKSIGNNVHWVEVVPKIVKNSTHVNVTVTTHHVWFLPRMHDSEFKLWVFVAIVILNIIVVLLAVCCTSDQKTEPKEVRPLGDLDAKMYLQNQPPAKNWSLGKLLQKIHDIWPRAPERNSKYTQMDNLRMAHVSTGSQSSRRPSSGIYDFYHEDDEFNNTYEVPVFTRQPEPNHHQYSTDIHMPAENQQRTVSFSLPSSSEELMAGNRRTNRRPGGPPILSLGKYLNK